MISSDIKSYLNSIGVELNSSSIQILKAIIKVGAGLSRPVTFKQILHQINARRKQPFSEAWVYKCLKNLEQAGFLTIQSIGNPKRYMVTEENMLTTLAKMCHKRIVELNNAKRQLVSKRDLIQNGNLAQLAGHLEKTLTKSSIESGSSIVEGIENIKRAFDDEICEVAKHGDIIRVTGYLHIVESGIIGPEEESIIKAAIKGVNVQGLLIPTIPAKRGMEAFKRYLQNVSEILLNALDNKMLQVRMLDEPVLTYRMISLNSDKMILYLSHSIECVTAALCHNDVNPRLIEDAISTFDNLWNNARDLSGVLLSFFS